MHSLAFFRDQFRIPQHEMSQVIIRGEGSITEGHIDRAYEDMVISLNGEFEKYFTIYRNGHSRRIKVTSMSVIEVRTLNGITDKKLFRVSIERNPMDEGLCCE